MLAPLTCRTIGDLNGGVAERVIDEHIKKAVDDMEDRGLEDGKPRKVVITLDMIKHTSDMTLIDVNVETKLPPSRVPTTSGSPKRRIVEGDAVNDLLFQTANPTNPDQGTFKAMDTEGGEVPNE